MATIESSNTKVDIKTLLTSDGLKSDIRIVVSDAKKAKKGTILFSPHTKNTSRSVKLTKSFHISDIEHALKLLEHTGDNERFFSRTTATARLLDKANQLEYMITGKPGKFKRVKGVLWYKNEKASLVMDSNNRLTGIVVFGECEVITHMCITVAALEYIAANLGKIDTTVYYKEY